MELLAVYEDLLAFPEPTTNEDSITETPKIDDSEILMGLAHRLLDQSKNLPPSSQSLSEIQETTQLLSNQLLISDQLPSHHVFVESLGRIVKIHKMLVSAGGEAVSSSESGQSLSMPTEMEWAALVRTCVSHSS